MYSLLGSIRAISNVSSSTAYCILNIWHIAHFNSTHWLASHYAFNKHQACSSRICETKKWNEITIKIEKGEKVKEKKTKTKIKRLD